MSRQTLANKYPDAFRRLGKDAELLKEIASIFLEDSPEMIRKIRQGIVENNLNAVAVVSHKLKGLVANIDVAMATELIQPLVDAARAGETEQARSLQEKIEHRIGSLERDVRACLNHAKSASPEGNHIRPSTAP